MVLLKRCTLYASKFGKLSNGHRTGKGQFSFQSQRKAMPKNVHSTTQARLQQYVNHELPDVQAAFRKGRGTRDQIATSVGSSKKQESSRKTNTSALLTMPKPLNYNKLWKILQEMGIPDHLTCLLRNLSAGQEATVRTGHGTTGWFQIGKGVHQVYIVTLLI